MADVESRDGSGSGSGKGSRRDKKSRVISYPDAARLFERAKNNNVRKPAFFFELRLLNGAEGLTKSQRERIRLAKWLPDQIKGIDFVSAFVKVMWPICTDVSKVEAFFEATSVTEEGILKKLVDCIFEDAGYTKTCKDETGDEWEDRRYPWYEWVFQSIRKSGPMASDAYGLHVFSCWLTAILCRTVKCHENPKARLRESDLPICVVNGLSEFVNAYQNQTQNIDLLKCAIAIETIEILIPKPVPPPEPVSLKATPEIPSNEKRMETRSSVSQKLGNKPARKIKYTEEDSDDEAIDLTQDENKKTHLEQLQDAIKREDLPMREKEMLMDKIVHEFDLEFEAQGKKVKALEDEYEAMVKLYLPVKDAVVKDKASDKICKLTVDSFKKIGRHRVEVGKVLTLFQKMKPFLDRQDFTPGARPKIKRKLEVAESSNGNSAIVPEGENRPTFLTHATAKVKRFQPQVQLTRCDVPQISDPGATASSSIAAEMDMEIFKKHDSTQDSTLLSRDASDGTQADFHEKTVASVAVPTPGNLVSVPDATVPFIIPTDEEIPTVPGTTNPTDTESNVPVVMQHADVEGGLSPVTEANGRAPAIVIESIQNSKAVEDSSMTSLKGKPSAADENEPTLIQLGGDSSPVSSVPQPTTFTGANGIVDSSITTSLNGSTLVLTGPAVSGGVKSTDVEKIRSNGNMI